MQDPQVTEDTEIPVDAFESPVDDLDERVQQTGGFSTTLSSTDRNRLRMVVKHVHLRHYPGEFVTDYEADKVIDAIAPATAEYLIRKHVFKEG